MLMMKAKYPFLTHIITIKWSSEMGKLVAVVGDRTTKGGYIITGAGYASCGGRNIALVGDLVSCPKCGTTGKIIEGAPNLT